jgi:poly(3-hydroxybutyrate) depolymerase
MSGMKYTWRTIVLVALALTWANPATAAKIQFKFKSWAGPPLRVFASRPVHLASDRPVVFVMHGVNRNADEYRDQWHDLANEHDFLLVVPEFSQRGFPGAERYNLGNVIDQDGKVVNEAQWSYSAIEPIFDEVRRRFSMTTERYSLYGHSAGAQFVHRFIFHVPSARVSQIVSANAGWYMMPDYEQIFPYGLEGSAVSRERLQAALQLPVTILLGEMDTDPEHPNLRRTPEATAQGEHRLARGYSFFDAARAYSGRLDVPFNWQLVTVPGADHDNRLMAPAALPYLLNASKNIQ